MRRSQGKPGGGTQQLLLVTPNPLRAQQEKERVRGDHKRSLGLFSDNKQRNLFHTQTGPPSYEVSHLPVHTRMKSNLIDSPDHLRNYGDLGPLSLQLSLQCDTDHPACSTCAAFAGSSSPATSSSDTVLFLSTESSKASHLSLSQTGPFHSSHPRCFLSFFCFHFLRSPSLLTFLLSSSFPFVFLRKHLIQVFLCMGRARAYIKNSLN